MGTLADLRAPIEVPLVDEDQDLPMRIGLGHVLYHHAETIEAILTEPDTAAVPDRRR